MAVKVVSVTPDESRTTAIAKLSSDKKGPDAITELSEMGAKTAAITAAQDCLVDPRVNGDVKIYAVDADGKMVEDPKTQKVAGYVGEISLTKRLL